MSTFNARQGTKGTVVVYGRTGHVAELFPATVTHAGPGGKSCGSWLIVQLDGVEEDHKTFTRNVLGRKLEFTLNQKRRWISCGHYYPRDDEMPGGMHFVPGQQIYEPLPF